MPIIQIQRRMMELGRVRLGEKGPKGEPRRLSSFRFTSASRALLEAVANIHGGTVEAWPGAPDEGYFQVTTDATSLNIILPPVYSDADGSPTLPYSQWFELWSGGGCQRRCDGLTESLSGKPCMCDPEKRKAGAVSECKVTTRVSFMLPDVPGLGVWRLDSHGWNAAVELPTTLEVLNAAAREQKFVPAVLSMHHRTRKVDGQTRRYIVPVIELPDVTVRQLASGNLPLAINAPAAPVGERPGLPAPPEPPDNPVFDSNGPAGFGEPPELPMFDESNSLTEKLLTFAEGRGYREQAQAAVIRNRDAHTDDPDTHVAWLRSQVARAEAAAGGQSEFEAMAAAAQAARQEQLI